MMATTWPVKPVQDKSGNPFYPKAHAAGTVCTDGLTVEQHLAGIEGFATATASGNGYTIDVDFVFKEGSKIVVKFTSASTSAAPFITVGGTNYPIKKANGNAAKITKDSYLNLVCGTNSFILLGEGGEYGTATATEVLAGYTLGTENGVVNGSIPVITGVGTGDRFDATNSTVGVYDDDSKNYVYLGITPDSYYKGITWVRKEEPNLISSCIKKGATILGVAGSASVIDTSGATATAANILSGKTAGVNGSMITGTIPSRGAATIVPTTTNQTIGAGQYLSGDQIIVGDGNFVEGNIKNGVTMFGKTGTFTNDGTLAANKMLSGVVGYSKGTRYTGSIGSKGATTITPGTSNQTISAGVYLSGNITILGSSNLVSGNIKSGVNIFGVVGSMSGLTSARWQTKVYSGVQILSWPNGPNASVADRNNFSAYNNEVIYGDRLYKRFPADFHGKIIQSVTISYDDSRVEDYQYISWTPGTLISNNYDNTIKVREFGSYFWVADMYGSSVNNNAYPYDPSTFLVIEQYGTPIGFRISYSDAGSYRLFVQNITFSYLG